MKQQNHKLFSKNNQFPKIIIDVGLLWSLVSSYFCAGWVFITLGLNPTSTNYYHACGGGTEKF